MNGTRRRLTRRGMAVLAALGAVAGSLAAAGPAAASGTAAASGPAAASGTAGRVPAIAGAVSTVAGGVGGPGPATKVPSPLPCGVAFVGGSLDGGYGSADFPFSGVPRAGRGEGVTG